MYKLFLKRALDVICSFLALIILFPVFILISIILFFSNNGNPYFFQKRPGKNELIFNVIKFKTMNDKRDCEGNLLPDSKRLTPIGSFLRKTSLDEIPQLLNVLKGDMSLVGPRPLLPQYLNYYTELEGKRHLVRPGITGLAQTKGRNNLHWEERLSYDVQYVEQLSFLLDVEILFRTFLNVVANKDVQVIPGESLGRLDEMRSKL